MKIPLEVLVSVSDAMKAVSAAMCAGWPISSSLTSDLCYQRGRLLYYIEEAVKAAPPLEIAKPEKVDA